MKLHELQDNPGARRKKILVGRGIGSGRGKTSTRGGKGQTARTGVRLKGFQGGQMPLSRRLPKRGFTNIHKLHFVAVNLGDIQNMIDLKKIDVQQVITPEILRASGMFKKVRDGVRVLGEGALTTAINLKVHGVSASAMEAIQKLGGSVTLL